jgi:hypothetical protein
MWNRNVADRTGKSRQIKEWAREALALPAEATLMVSELACSEPGCPPLETVIAVLDDTDAPRHFKIHRPMTDVTRADVATITLGDDHEHE